MEKASGDSIFMCSLMTSAYSNFNNFIFLSGY